MNDVADSIQGVSVFSTIRRKSSFHRVLGQERTLPVVVVAGDRRDPEEGSGWLTLMGQPL